MNAVIYARFSSDNQREESIDAQVRAIREYSLKEGHSILKVYADEARSATTDQRPAFLQMMRDAERHMFEAIIVHKLDRFSRDRYDSAFYKRHMKRHGVRLISVLERLDDSPESIIMESVLEGMAEYYSRNLAREVMKGMRETAYQGKHTGGKPPLGYDVATDRTYQVNEVEAAAVRTIFSMYAAGQGYGPIIDTLNAAGHRTKNGNPFGKNSIHEILKNEKYAGVFVFNRSEKKAADGKRNNHKVKSDDEVIRMPGVVPAIVDTATWESVRNKMAENKKTAAKYRAKVVYLLSGKLVCGKCGSAMLGNAGSGGRNKITYNYYECGAKKRTKTCDMKAVSKPVIEEMVIDALYGNLFNPTISASAAAQIFEYAQAGRPDMANSIKALRGRMATVEKELGNIVEAIAKGLYHESMKEKMDDLEASRAHVRMLLVDAETRDQAHSLSLNQIHAFLKRFEKIKEMPPDEQRQAIELFVERVVVYEDHIDIEIFTPDGSPGGKAVRRVIEEPGDGSFGYGTARSASTKET